jgi:RNA polymerase sigma-70 factor, ECF subfamily
LEVSLNRSESSEPQDSTGQAPDRPQLSPEDQALLARLQAGDKSACTECIERYGPGVYRLALRLTQNEADAEEVMQETFLNAFKAIDSFEGRSAITTWLYRIAHNVALMRLRRPSPYTVPIDQVTDVSENTAVVPRQLFDACCLPEPEFESEETRLALEQAIAALPVSLRSAFVLREVEGLSTRAAAEVLDVSPDVVKTRLSRARQRLRQELSGRHNAG